MTDKSLHISTQATVFRLLLVLFISVRALSQSQSINGRIEGTTFDQNKAAVANAVIKITNLENGYTRTAATDERGIYGFPLLPLGTYRLSAEAAKFQKVVREGITLTTGQTATVDIELAAGDVQEIVTVSLDSSIADPGKIDLGRVMTVREVENLPLIARNPYNFALLQANVTGRPGRGFGFPTINANGYPRRVNYQFDGNNNTQADRAGVRLLIISDTYVKEVHLITNGFAAEFGNTPGLIMNVVTPSGTNALSISAGYRFRRPSFYARPFNYPSAARLPDNNADDLTAVIGGPIVKDRWHFFLGYEYVKRDDKALATRLSTIRETDKAQLISAGLPASIFPHAIPSLEAVPFYILRTDIQLSDKYLLAARFNHSDLLSENFMPGGTNTLERSINTSSVDYSLGVQLVADASKVLNELRFQFARRNTRNVRNHFSGSGPAIVIANPATGVGVANFGSPDNADTINPLEKSTQVQNNMTRTQGAHVIKFGGGFNFIDDLKRSAIFSRYTFPSISAYLAAKNGTDPYSYERFEETFGDPEVKYSSIFLNFFAQDDWKFSRRLKFNAGVRYDVYRVPKADRSAPFPASRKFHTDKNNIAPRIGFVFSLRDGDLPLVIRAGAGLYYESPWLNMYERALLKSGNPKFSSFRFLGNSGGTRERAFNAPAFPNTFSGSLPSGSALPRQDIDTIAPDLENMYAIHSNLQIEQAITANMSFAVGYVHSAGRHIPVYRNINCLPTASRLADGRPILGTRVVNPTTGNVISEVSCASRIFPQFQNILMAESAGVSRYDALTLQLNRRFARGVQFSSNYTLSKAFDDAPEQNLATGNIQGLVLSDPYDRSFDRGYSFADQRHTFLVSLVARPGYRSSSRTLRYLLNNNQFGLIAVANSGERFNIVSTRDLNLDGIFGAGITNADRPAGITRNSGRTPAQFNTDLRYSRFFRFSDRHKLEFFAEFQNLFNINSIVQYNNVAVPTNPVTGELIGAIPNFRTRNSSVSQESRQLQLGIKLQF